MSDKPKKRKNAAKVRVRINPASMRGRVSLHGVTLVAGETVEVSKRVAGLLVGTKNRHGVVLVERVKTPPTKD